MNNDNYDISFRSSRAKSIEVVSFQVFNNVLIDYSFEEFADDSKEANRSVLRHE